eukprot:CAMPEP_0116118414 /NCGR_PEP_ID=MMETSP0329-20121206/2091_1 /TAXON_ID=697910 /ORGANISM="Pseudo-nitzschia arenysensis, Strain B593" /LENGTH=760 /DNA_ID=CAMNT_0003612039 /DNA_START=284 /DNA_END=2566 /DNA_ORIENTATION=-
MSGGKHNRGVNERRINPEIIDSGLRVLSNARILLLFFMILALLHSIISSRHMNYVLSINEITDDRPSSATQLLRVGSQRQQEQRDQRLPHWRLGTDCSLYDFGCFAVAEIQEKYLPYPFTLSVRKEIELSDHAENSLVTTDDEWSVENISELPTEWIEYLENKETKSNVPVKDRNYLYPPKATGEEYDSCMNLAMRQDKSTTEQLDILLAGDSPRIVPEPDTNMVAFTVSDYAYIKDMIHDMFQMMDDVVGFAKEHFFLIAIDRKSAELACRYGYPVVLWKADENNLRDAVANTKLIVSHDLVKRGINFFFTEMDVWWIRSPKPKLVDFQTSHNDKSDSGKHLYFSGHQYDYRQTNIGVFAVMANEFTEEYFRVCLDLLNEKPETHDQFVMQQVQNLFTELYNGKDMKFGKQQFKPEGAPKTPDIKHPFKSLMFSPHEIVADERPTTTHKTLAIHTLCGSPLQAPHGKIMNAKELGVYYGFRSYPKGTPSGNPTSSGYYVRRGEKRRYLWLDSELRNNFYSFSDSNHYQIKAPFEWTMAILIAIARKTDRILVLPQVFQRAGVYFAWTLMDYSGVSDIVDFRETNFLNNPKAWRNGGVGTDQWPFESVVNTAMFEAVDEKNTISIYTQVSDRSKIVSKKVWKSTERDSLQWLDAWVGSLSAIPELDSAEVLLVNPDLLMENYINESFKKRLKKRGQIIKAKGEDHKDTPSIGTFTQEVLEIYSLLGWCWDMGFRNTANKVSASNSCYGVGKRSTVADNIF